MSKLSREKAIKILRDVYGANVPTEHEIIFIMNHYNSSGTATKALSSTPPKQNLTKEERRKRFHNGLKS